jgi:hypothetical protein
LAYQNPGELFIEKFGVPRDIDDVIRYAVIFNHDMNSSPSFAITARLPLCLQPDKICLLRCLLYDARQLLEWQYGQDFRPFLYN